MTNRRAFLVQSGVAVLGTAIPMSSMAQAYPSKPIHFVVPLAGGGSADMLARLVGQHLTQLWGQPVMIELRPGGGTVIGTSLVARSPADGYTLLFTSNSLVINAKLRSDLPYDGMKALTPVALMATSPQVIAVNVSSPHQTIKDWMDDARSRPGAVSIASLGPDTTQHIAIGTLQHTSGLELIYVPYSGGSQAVNAVLGGHVDTVLGNLAEIAPHIEAGKLRPLAVTTRERLPTLKHVPTIAESGFPQYEAVAWFGVTAPTGTPRDVVTLLSEGIGAAMNDPQIRQQLIAFGLQPNFLGPAEFGAHIAMNYERYSKAIDTAKIKGL